MSRIIPFGARMFVDDLEPATDLVARGKAAGLHVVVLDENAPKPTEGIVRAVGNDPLLQECVQVGDHVTFARHAGIEQWVEGHKFRCLELREVIAVIKPDPITSSESGTPQ